MRKRNRRLLFRMNLEQMGWYKWHFCVNVVTENEFPPFDKTDKWAKKSKIVTKDPPSSQEIGQATHLYVWAGCCCWLLLLLLLLLLFWLELLDLVVDLGMGKWDTGWGSLLLVPGGKGLEGELWEGTGKGWVCLGEGSWEGLTRILLGLVGVGGGIDPRTERGLKTKSGWKKIKMKVNQLKAKPI